MAPDGRVFDVIIGLSLATLHRVEPHTAPRAESVRWRTVPPVGGLNSTTDGESPVTPVTVTPNRPERSSTRSPPVSMRGPQPLSPFL